MKVRVETNKLTTNNVKSISTTIEISGQKLQTASTFNYLGAVITDEGSKSETLSRIAQTRPVLTKLMAIWKDRNI